MIFDAPTPPVGGGVVLEITRSLPVLASQSGSMIVLRPDSSLPPPPVGGVFLVISSACPSLTTHWYQ